MKLDVPKRWFDKVNEISGFRFQTPTGGRKVFGLKAGSFDMGGDLNVTGNISAVDMAATGPVTLPTYAVAGVPDATTAAGQIIYVSDGAAGSPCLAVSDGTNWLRCDTLAAISDS